MGTSRGTSEKQEVSLTSPEEPLDVLRDLLAEVRALRELVAQMDDGSLLTAREAAERLGTSRDWVYENAAHLGVIRLPGGTQKPRIRFRMRSVIAALRGTEPEADQKPIGDTKSTNLLPVRRPSPAERGRP